MKNGKERKGFKFVVGRNFRRFLFLVVQTLIVLCVIMFVNLFGSFVRSKFDFKVDLWPGRFNSLSSQAKSYLKNYDRKIKFLRLEPSYDYGRLNIGTNHFDEVINGFVASNSAFESKLVHFGKELEEELKGVELIDYSSQIPEKRDGTSIIVIDETDPEHRRGISLNEGFFACEHCSTYEKLVKESGKSHMGLRALGSEDMCAFAYERYLIGALEKFADKNLVRVAVTTGHGEGDLSMNSLVTSTIGAKLEKVNLSNGDIGPENQLLLIASPRNDFSDEEIEKVRAFLNGGGRLIYFAGVMQKPLEKLEQFLKSLGIHLSEGIVLSVEGEKPNALIGVDLKDQNNAYTEKMVERKWPLVFGGCRPMILKDAQDGWQLFEVCRTSGDCVRVTQDTVNKLKEIKDSEKTQFTVVGGAQKDLGSGKMSKVLVVASGNVFNGFGAKVSSGNNSGFGGPYGGSASVVNDYYLTSNSNFFHVLLKDISGQKVFDYMPIKMINTSRQLEFDFDNEGNKLDKDQSKFRFRTFICVVLCLPFMFLAMSFVVLILRRRKK